MATIPLCNGGETLVDDADFDRASVIFWYKSQAAGCPAYVRGRVRTPGGKSRQVFLHRFLLDVPKGMFVDHINGDGLDNRRCNLRPCTRSQNQFNSKTNRGASRYRGVSFSPNASRPWMAIITVNKKAKYLGSFETQEEAAHAYDAAARQFAGEFAKLNFPCAEM
jgi:hypothetical protein